MSNSLYLSIKLSFNYSVAVFFFLSSSAMLFLSAVAAFAAAMISTPVSAVVPPSIIITSGAEIPAHNGLYFVPYHTEAGEAAFGFTTNATDGWSYTLSVTNNTLTFSFDNEAFTASIYGEQTAGMS